LLFYNNKIKGIKKYYQMMSSWTLIILAVQINSNHLINPNKDETIQIIIIKTINMIYMTNKTNNNKKLLKTFIIANRLKFTLMKWNKIWWWWNNMYIINNLLFNKKEISDCDNNPREKVIRSYKTTRTLIIIMNIINNLNINKNIKISIYNRIIIWISLRIKMSWLKNLSICVLFWYKVMWEDTLFKKNFYLFLDRGSFLKLRYWD